MRGATTGLKTVLETCNTMTPPHTTPPASNKAVLAAASAKWQHVVCVLFLFLLLSLFVCVFVFVVRVFVIHLLVVSTGRNLKPYTEGIMPRSSLQLELVSHWLFCTRYQLPERRAPWRHTVESKVYEYFHTDRSKWHTGNIRQFEGTGHRLDSA